MCLLKIVLYSTRGILENAKRMRIGQRSTEKLTRGEWGVALMAGHCCEVPRGGGGLEQG